MAQAKSDFIPIADMVLAGNEKKYVLEAVESAWISSKGPFVKKFEEAFARYIGARFSSSCSNGTSALHLAYAACGIQKGDEVIMPALTFVATANAAAFLGAKPVFADVDPATWNLDPNLIEKKITKKTKAIVPVHLYGVPCDMKPIMEIAERHGLTVIEDCAEAHGAKYRGKKVGTFGDCAAFSFFGNKIITTGEGGMVVSNSREIQGRVDFLKSHGQDAKRHYWHSEVAFNYRMTALQAAFGLGQLEGIEKVIQKKREIHDWYVKELSFIKGICFQEALSNSESVWWMSTLMIEKPFVLNREQLQKRLMENGIDSRPSFVPAPSLPMYKASERFAISEKISANALSLPSGANLSESQLGRVVSEIQSASA